MDHNGQQGLQRPYLMTTNDLGDSKGVEIMKETQISKRSFENLNLKTLIECKCIFSSQYDTNMTIENLKLLFNITIKLMFGELILKFASS